MSEARVSVVVTITDGDPYLSRCLRALESQTGARPLEIIVPVHPALDDVEALRRRHPAIRFVDIENMPFTEPPPDPGLAHLVYDLRRASGLRAARGEIIAMTEDHALPPPDWCARMVALHAALPHAAIGGAIDHGGRGLLSWAAYFTEFIRYQNPVREGPAKFLSDVNVSYKRKPLEAIGGVWSIFYHETAVHEALTGADHTLWLSPALALQHTRGPLSLATLCRQRAAWARVFAGRRAQTISPGMRRLLAVLAPALPALFLLRCWAVVLRTRRNVLPLILLTPILVLLFAFWAYGESVGYFTARPTRERVDPSVPQQIRFFGLDLRPDH